MSHSSGSWSWAFLPWTICTLVLRAAIIYAGALLLVPTFLVLLVVETFSDSSRKLT